MRPSIHVYRPVERPHELDVISLHFASHRILFFQDARTAKTAPLVRSRVRPAEIFRCAPDRFRRGFSPQTACSIEWNSKVIAQWRLAERAKSSGILVTFEPPLTGNVRRILRTRRLAKSWNSGQHGHRN